MRFQGKNNVGFILLFAFYNIFPVLLFCNGVRTPMNVFWNVIWIIYYSSNILWIPILLKHEVNLFDDRFILSFGLSSTEVNYCDIIETKESNDSHTHKFYIKTTDQELCLSIKDHDHFISEINNRR